MHTYMSSLASDEDRVSNLPNSILYHILSLLPTKEAVATCILSKSWKSHWKNIHNLTFRDRDVRFADDFAHFVSTFLLFLNSQSIDQFSLETEKYSCDYDVSNWVGAALARNLKVLQITNKVFSEGEVSFRLPSGLYTCETLAVLVLVGGIELNVPSLVSLPNLKTLRLKSVMYKSDECVRNLISGCSSLETLEIKRDPWDGVVTFTISSPTLTNLTFKFYQEGSYFSPGLDCKLEINAPALRFLDLLDYMSKDFSVESFGLLEDAIVRTLVYDENVPLVNFDHYCNAVARLAQGTCNLKHLYLSGDILQDLSRAGVCLSFPRLTQLTVVGQQYLWGSLLNLIEGANNLKSLTVLIVEVRNSPRSRSGEEWKFFHSSQNLESVRLFVQYIGLGVTHGRSWRNPENVPICVSSCLETMSVGRLTGLRDELEMVAYILKNGKGLNTMKIEICDELGNESRSQLIQKVLKFPRTSINCEIAFS